MDRLGVGDVRLAARGAWLIDQIVATGSLVLRRLGVTRAGEVGAHRYLASDRVSPAGIMETFAARTVAASAGRRIVAAQDTTEVNFSGRGLSRRGLGPGGDGKSPGFFIHPVVAIDAEDEAVLGLVDAQIWSRSGEELEDRHKRAIEAKESQRWLAGTAAARRLTSAREVVVVADREGDIYSHFARRPASVHVLIRSHHDREVEGGGRLSSVAADWPQEETKVVVPPRGPGDKGRVARVMRRYGTVLIKGPASRAAEEPAQLELGMVELREFDPPAGVKPLFWRLLTTLPVGSSPQAEDIVRLYRLRWRIEEVFRTLKSDGLQLEDTQIEEAKRLFRLTALALGAAVRIIQLVDARNGSCRPMSDVLDDSAIEAVTAIGNSRQGATARQKNPHPPASLAWLAWIVARFGGWNCYGKPPGPKTMAIGWKAFAATLAGFLIARQADV